jgi:hypothetical protein
VLPWVVCVLSIAFFLIFLVFGRRAELTGTNPFSLLLLHVGSVVVLGIGVLNLFAIYYDRLPQEFGGVRPRCAELIVTDPASLKALQSFLSIKPSALGSFLVDVYYQSGDVLLIKPPGQAPSYKRTTAAALPTRLSQIQRPAWTKWIADEPQIIYIYRITLMNYRTPVYEIKRAMLQAIKWCG